MARSIVIGVTVLVYLPVLLLSLSPLAAPDHVSYFVLPVMGFCPLPSRSRDSGYSITNSNIWGICLLIPLIALAGAAIVKKSLPLAIAYASLLALSVMLIILRAMSDFNGYHNLG
jgi:hypothetical protein